MKDLLEKPPLDILAYNQLDIKHENNKFMVVSKVSPDFILGDLSVRDLHKIKLFNTIKKQSDGFIVTDRLPPDTSNIDLDPIPFKLSTKNYGGEYSRYIFTDETDNVLHEGSIYRRQAEIMKLQGKYYLVSVVEVDHSPGSGKNKYAKFAVGEIVIDIGA